MAVDNAQFGSSADEEVPDILRTLIDRRGQAAFEDADLCSNLLNDHLPEQTWEVSLLVNAVRHGIPRQLAKAASTNRHLSDFAVSAAFERMSQETKIQPDAARWAVDCWAYALRVTDDKPRKPGGAPVEQELSRWARLYLLLKRVRARHVAGAASVILGFAVGWMILTTADKLDGSIVDGPEERRTMPENGNPETKPTANGAGPGSDIDTADRTATDVREAGTDEPPRAPAGNNLRVRIINSTSHTIRQLFVSQVSDDSWGQDRLDGRVIEPNYYFSFTLEDKPDNCLQDFWAVFSNGMERQNRQVDVCWNPELLY